MLNMINILSDIYVLVFPMTLKHTLNCLLNTFIHMCSTYTLRKARYDLVFYRNINGTFEADIDNNIALTTFTYRNYIVGFFNWL